MLFLLGSSMHENCWKMSVGADGWPWLAIMAGHGWPPPLALARWEYVARYLHACCCCILAEFTAGTVSCSKHAVAGKGWCWLAV